MPQDGESVAPPAPWELDGLAHILVYRFSRLFLSQAGGLLPLCADRFRGGWGAVLLVDYRHSPVGPYHELLFVPGRFALAGTAAYSITRAFVSTMASVTAGRANWGIPKEPASFTVADDGGAHRVVVTADNFRILEIKLQAGWLRLWAGTLVWPVPLAQVGEGRVFLTRLRGQGVIRPARVLNLSVDGSLFPDVAPLGPLFVLRVDRLRIGLPPAVRGGD